ncbi:MAG TPA: hypothetical protein VMB72_06685 [Acidimicrobiales bacterium]|nr:hypothetical protein [Acidimicrobiales bacterium]
MVQQGVSRTRPAHRRRRSASESRLRELGSHTPSLPAEALHVLVAERAHRLVRRIVLLVAIALLLALAGLQWFRPLPAPGFSRSLPATLVIPGTPPTLPWPGSGAATVAVTGHDTASSPGASAPLATGGLARLMTAYVVLRDHPLAPGGGGPPIAVTAPALAAQAADAAEGQPVVPLAGGESLDELQALEALLVGSGDDVATLLATWDGGTVPAFVARMNAEAHALGMTRTSFADPGGVAASSVSTSADMVRLGRAAMAVPALRAVVALPQVTLPVAGLVYNLDGDVGHDGFVGIETGAGPAAGGCFVFQAVQAVGGQVVTVTGALLGVQGPSPTDEVLADAETLVDAALADLRTATVAPVGTHVGDVHTPWGTTTPVTLGAPDAVVGWPGERFALRVHLQRLAPGLARGAVVGTLTVPGADPPTAALRAGATVPGPSALWRLTRW